MIKIVFNTILGLVLIFIWSRFVDLAQIWQKLSEANLIFLLPVFFCMFVSPFIRAIRLKVFLSEIKKIPLWDLVFLNGAAMLLNFFIPIRAGDFGKGVYLNTKYELSFGKSIIWVFMDRFIDFLIVLAVSSIFLLIIPTTLPKNLIVIISSLFCLSLLVTYLAVFRLDFSKKLVGFLTPLFIFSLIKIPFAKVTSFILDSFSVLKRSKKDLTALIVLTLLAYAADAGIWFFTFQSLGINPGFIKMYSGQMLSALTYLVPAAPGYVGSAEVSGILILSGVFGFEVNLASSMIVLSHITTAIFVIILGLISIFNLKLDLNQILKKALGRK